ncbi:MAG: DUF1588 domain-containing protein [Pirellulaceae bacterium]|nr:DUF1588 domain-containing protein [Pirellulaceae bacterium]
MENRQTINIYSQNTLQTGFPTLLVTFGLALGFLSALPIIEPSTSVEYSIPIPVESPQISVANRGAQVADRGREIYQRQCAECHGDDGQGTKKYPAPFEGDWTLTDLIDYIDESMPEENPSDCRGPDAQEVARYIFKTFFDSGTSANAETTGIEFSRLTVRQFRESVADLSLLFGNPPWRPEEHGLKAHYFAARNWTDSRKLSEQIDLQLDFSEGVPHFDPTEDYPSLPKPEKPPENKMNDGFSVYWSGALLAPKTGRYQIIVYSKNGFQLRLNGGPEPLIDRKVRSDDIEEHRAEIHLLGGRAYPLRIDFFSYPDPPAQIRLSWHPPNGVEEIVPSKYLYPHGMSESVALATSFPPDDSSWGFERGTSVSRDWLESVTSAAIEAADWFTERLWNFAKTKESAEDREEKVAKFCREFVQFAFCRELSDEDVTFFVSQHFGEDLPLKESAKRVILSTLTSPRFLYPELEQRDQNFRIARRLALTLWDSIPDRRLFELAQLGKLASEDVLREEIYRLLYDPRGREKLNTTMATWLKLDRGHGATRDPQRYPGFSEQLLVDLRRSLDAQIESVLWSKGSDYRRLFLDQEIFANSRLAEYYGLARQESENVENPQVFVIASVESQRRSGVLTHPYIMTSLAYFGDSSPIHRGVFVSRSLLGRTLRPPNENFEPLTEDFAPEMTNRQRVEHQTADTECMKCHQVINPLGFSLENFDAVGRYRETDGKRSIDSSAVYESPSGERISLNEPRDLALLLANDLGAQQNFVKQVFREFARQPIEGFGPERLGQLHEKFVASDYNISELVVEIAKLLVTDSQ